MVRESSSIKTKVSKIDETRRLLDVEISENRVTQEFERAYNEVAKVAHVPGYRVGKAPRPMLEKYYSKEVKDEVIKHLVPDAFEEAVTEEKLAILGYPDIKDVNLGLDKTLKFQAEFDVAPLVEIKKYKGINLKKKKVEINETEVDDYLKSLQGNLARYNSVDRAVKIQDYLIADVEFFVEGKQIGQKAENQPILVGDNFVIQPKELEGLKKSDEKDIEVTLPDNYQDKQYAGKKAKFHIKINEIKEKVLPEINDDFAKEMGEFENLDALKNEVRKELIALKERQNKTDLEQSLMEALLKESKLNVPKSMVERQTEHLVHEAKERLFKQGFSKEDIDKQDPEFREKFKDQALKQVKIYFILGHIAEIEGIDITQEDVDKAFLNMASVSRRPKEEIIKYYEEHNLMDRMREDLGEEKTIEFLLKESKIEETL